jgi:quinol monooxygenase YgiN
VLNHYVDGLDEEPGTEFFLLSIDPDDHDIVWLYEIFTNDAAQEAHRASHGFALLMNTMPDLLAQAPGILRINPLRLSLQNSLLRDNLSL